MVPCSKPPSRDNHRNASYLRTRSGCGLNRDHAISVICKKQCVCHLNHTGLPPSKIAKALQKRDVKRIDLNLIFTRPATSSVARGGAGGGGLEPPHWLVKYAKSHVFCAFEANFL